MEANTIRMLKHEIRTPINHIIGYSELVLEAALDDKKTEVVKLAGRLVEDGQTLAAEVEKYFRNTDEFVISSFAVLDGSLQAIISRMLLTTHAPELEENAWRQDVQHIRAAASRLQSLSSWKLVSAFAER